MAKRNSRTRKTKRKARTLSTKIAKVKRDDPGLTTKQAVGKAAGILRHQASKRGG